MKKFTLAFIFAFFVQPAFGQVVVQRFQKVVITSNASDALVVSGSVTAAGVTATTFTGALVGNVTGIVTGSLVGNASTATALQTARAINGTNFDGTAAITVTSAAGTLTGTTLNATVIGSSLTSLGTIASLTATTAGIGGAPVGGIALTVSSASDFAQLRLVGTVSGGSQGLTFLDSVNNTSGLQIYAQGTGGSAPRGDFYSGFTKTFTIQPNAASVTGTLATSGATGIGCAASGSYNLTVCSTTFGTVNFKSTDSASTVEVSLSTPTTGGGLQIFHSGGGITSSTQFWEGASKKMTLAYDNWGVTITGSQSVVVTSNGQITIGGGALGNVVQGRLLGPSGASQTAHLFDVVPDGSSPGTIASFISATGIWNGAVIGNASTATTAAAWTTARNLAGNSVDGSANVAFSNAFIVKGTADSGLTGAQFMGALGTGIIKNTTTTGTFSIAVAGDFPTLNQNTTGSAATLTTARTINGTSFNGSANITVTADASTLTGTTLASGVTASSLTSFGSSPTIVTPTIASFTNATHNHSNAAGGGTIAESVLTFTDITTNNVTTSAHGYMSKLPGGTSTFYRADGTFAAVTTADSSVTFTDITTGNASTSNHGFQKKLSGNAYDFTLGDGTYGQTIATGATTTSKPWIFSQTWNTVGTTYKGLTVSITATAEAVLSHLFEVAGGSSGSTCYFAVLESVQSGCVVVAHSAGMQVTGNFLATSALMSTTAYPYQTNRFYMNTKTVNQMNFGAQGGGVAWGLQYGAAPTLTSGFGTGATIVGIGSLGRVTIGTSPGVTAVLTFVDTWDTNIPICDVQDETTGVRLLAVPTTTTLTITLGATIATDKITYRCNNLQA